MKVFDQYDTEVDGEVFEELVTSRGTFRVTLINEDPGNQWPFLIVFIKLKGWDGSNNGSI